MIVYFTFIVVLVVDGIVQLMPFRIPVAAYIVDMG